MRVAVVHWTGVLMDVMRAWQLRLVRRMSALSWMTVVAPGRNVLVLDVVARYRRAQDVQCGLALT